ncbi:glutathione peroxidase [Candidatus Amarobacter glycogenicus]|jgi:glutathione peroxidase|uniref:glutathione peroxidase n=1 Tax=Candidatus Amarobacter glycogenicus TaxID=3140699 RepID=UPI0031346D1B|nr:glutathione peroxidase [Dehalococcoidia bacterium]
MVLERTMTRLDGSEEDLSLYKGKVVMLVNVASKCGLTPQYKGLQALYDRYGQKGLVILGFPANDFMGQEPGTDEEIGQFCELNFGVTFPLFSKISVKGEAMHPLYREITTMPEPIGGDVLWNFQKYLLNKSGDVVRKIGPQTKPEDPEVSAAIEALLEE